MRVKEVWQGNEALSEAAVRSGCIFFGGYPITPQTSITEYLSWRLPEVGGHFVQANSETSAISMIIGASIAGARCMTATSGPGLSLMQEGLSAISAGRYPAVLVNVNRAGAGTADITASQSDYALLTTSLGHGGLHGFVLAPCSVQESVNFMCEAFDIAEKYRCMVIILIDAVIGQMMEGIYMPPFRESVPSIDKPWVPSGADGKPPRIAADRCFRRDTNDISEIPMLLEQEFFDLEKLYREWEKTETRCESYLMEDAQYAVVAWGSAARIARTGIDLLRREGIRVGLLRPITLFPFPRGDVEAISPDLIKGLLTVEMAAPGQLVEDVRKYADRSLRLEEYKRAGGQLVTVDGVINAVKLLAKG